MIIRQNDHCVCSKESSLYKNPDTDGSGGLLDQSSEVLIRDSELIVVNMDMPWENPTGLLVNTNIDEPYTISVIQLDVGDM